MVEFTRDIPAATQLLSDSQPLIKNNFNSSDTTFARDHYAFSNTTGKDGFHNTVTQPEITTGAHAVTTTNPIIYAMNTGGTTPPLLQWSRGISNAVPTPITHIHSPSTPLSITNGGQINIFNFNAISGVCIAEFYLVDLDAGDDSFAQEIVSFNSVGPVAYVRTIKRKNSFLDTNFAGTTLRVQNSGPTLNSVYWTLHLLRAS